MGGAIGKGLIKSGFVSASDIIVADKSKRSLSEMEKFGVGIANTNADAVKEANVVIIAVKPSQADILFQEIKHILNPEKILISIIAGMEIAVLQKACGEDIPVVRAMPNTAIELSESLTCISYGINAYDHKNYVTDLFNNLGKTIEVPEQSLAAATVLSSCGIAFALRYIRAAMEGGIEIGFSAELAKFITAQTVKGATELILQNGNHPEAEIDRVTTPGGITIAGLNEMESEGFSSSLIMGILTSYEKISF